MGKIGWEPPDVFEVHMDNAGFARRKAKAGPMIASVVLGLFLFAVVVQCINGPLAASPKFPAHFQSSSVGAESRYP